MSDTIPLVTIMSRITIFFSCKRSFILPYEKIMKIKFLLGTKFDSGGICIEISFKMAAIH